VNRGAGPRTGGPVLPELGTRLFRVLYDAYDLIMVDGVNIAVPKDGTIPVFAGTLTEIAWQIAEHARPGHGAR
jgi:hypothetical protein